MKLYSAPEMKLLLDYSSIGLSDEFISEKTEAINKALGFMESLDAGAIANPDEKRMVGHYWLRAPQLAPNAEIRAEIKECVKSIDKFVKAVHSGEIRPSGGSADAVDRFRKVLICGIGGSSLGPEFVSTALASPDDKMTLYFLNNTDPDGMDAVFASLRDELENTLVIVISKSGGTVETRNMMMETKAFYASCGVDFASRAICVSGRGSQLWKEAEKEDWLALFPMWDWVGGRTSVMSAVGLLPLGLQGVDCTGLLAGAAECDAWCRSRDIRRNPAALMALAWLARSGGKGGTTNVVLPYRDSLQMLPKYLQQLVMESLGKEYDLDGKLVNQGLAVMGNKGTSDQHSYVQQLIAGPNNTFVSFVQVLQTRSSGIETYTDAEDPTAEFNAATSGDCLHAYMLGTRKALAVHGKYSMIVTVPAVDAPSLGRIIALFERAVGLYGSLINVNPYHQPAVEAGKKAAKGLLALQAEILDTLKRRNTPATAEELAADILAAAPDADANEEDVYRLLLHLAATGRVNIHSSAAPESTAFEPVI